MVAQVPQAFLALSGNGKRGNRDMLTKSGK
jgi:hypothetical protein